jgi:hypothetical protein
LFDVVSTWEPLRTFERAEPAAVSAALLDVDGVDISKSLHVVGRSPSGSDGFVRGLCDREGAERRKIVPRNHAVLPFAAAGEKSGKFYSGWVFG